MMAAPASAQAMPCAINSRGSIGKCGTRARPQGPFNATSIATGVGMRHSSRPILARAGTPQKGLSARKSVV
jgi:hypothetical protein